MINIKKGFTIIELIVVVAIIAILAAVVMFGVTQYINKSKIAAVKVELDQISKAAVIYYGENGSMANFCGETTSTSYGWNPIDCSNLPTIIRSQCEAILKKLGSDTVLICLDAYRNNCIKDPQIVNHQLWLFGLYVPNGDNPPTIRPCVDYTGAKGLIPYDDINCICGQY